MHTLFMRNTLIRASLGILLILNTEFVNAMSIIGFKVCLASQMTSTVTENGQPVVGAKVIRTVKFKNKDYVTETTTDQEGKFVLPPLFERTVWKHTPFEVVIWNVIKIHHNGIEHTGVDISKRNFDMDGEINNFVQIERKMTTFIPYEFTCELNDEPYDRLLESNNMGISGKCLLLGENRIE